MDKKYYNELNQRIQASGKSWLAVKLQFPYYRNFSGGCI